MISYEEAKAKLDVCGQSHALRFWDQLDGEAREALLAQIETIDPDSINLMQSMLGEAAAGDADTGAIEPAPVVDLAALAEREASDGLIKIGCAALSKGDVGVVLVAGGQGSRLGFDGPKGAYLLAPISGASLFEIHARKILALEKKFGAEIPFYIMTSQVNDVPTRAFFAEHDNFGLDADRVKFFTQGMWPALDGDGKVMLDSPSHIFMSPDGHGGTLTALQQRGMFDDMDRRGIKTIFFFQVDNPLVEIADPAFIGLHIKESADISIKVCSKRDPEEGLGIVAIKGGRSMIVEYSELTPEQMNERLPDGNLKLRFGSVAIHVFSVPFLKQEAAAQMPLHVAHKKVPFVDAAGVLVKPEAPNAYKFEKFIFDVVPDALKAMNVEFDRAAEFSPVKNATGSDSPATSQRDMILKASGWLEACGVDVPRDADGIPTHKIEIDPCFALGPEDLAGKLGERFRLDADILLSGDEEVE
jgi:UDP-N-acetylglucosamine/UDP-N-acetylgalactosamine diphosphorylase